MGEPTDGDQVNTGCGDARRRRGGDPARCLGDRPARDRRNGAAQLVRGHALRPDCKERFPASKGPDGKESKRSIVSIRGSPLDTVTTTAMRSAPAD